MLAQCRFDKVSIIPQSQANRSVKIMLSKFEYPLSWENVTSRHYKKYIVHDTKKTKKTMSVWAKTATFGKMGGRDPKRG